MMDRRKDRTHTHIHCEEGCCTVVTGCMVICGQGRAENFRLKKREEKKERRRKKKDTETKRERDPRETTARFAAIR